MIGPPNLPSQNGPQERQCHYFVTRKKRFCRMTVRPGRQYCGEHEPKPKTNDDQDDTRIPCPLDPKHTCYASKLEKHLSICNAKKMEVPAFIVNNINTVTDINTYPRKPLSEVPMDFLEKVIEKIECLFTEHISNHLSVFTAPPIHPSVVAEFIEPHRGEKSLRHLRQVSSLLHMAEAEGLVQNGTCYVELGAGKGQLSYYLGVSWCQDTQSRVLSIDRAALRHKRDNLLRSERLKNAKSTERNNHSEETVDNSESKLAVRLRADLAHLVLDKVPVVGDCARVVGFAKHLCGVAMDYALRCISSVDACAGAVLATCCHHRCERQIYVANHLLQNLGLSPEEFNVIISIVSWATCGDGRSRDLRKNKQQKEVGNETNHLEHVSDKESSTDGNESLAKDEENMCDISDKVNGQKEKSVDLKDHTHREQIGRKAKLLVDWGRVLYLKEKGFDARLCYYVPSSVSLENVCIVVKRSVL